MEREDEEREQRGGVREVKRHRKSLRWCEDGGGGGGGGVKRDEQDEEDQVQEFRDDVIKALRPPRFSY